MSAQDRETADRLQIEESFISYCAQFPPSPFYPHPHCDPSKEELRLIAHCRFYGALLLRDVGMAGGDEEMVRRIQAFYQIDRGELQRFWESSEMYLQLVTSMCEALNWSVLKRLLHSLRRWFKSRIPKSFACFLHEDDKVPFPCIQLLSEEELTVRDIAEMDEGALARLLRNGMAGKFGMTRMSELLNSESSKSDQFVVKQRYDYARFLSDMERVAGVLKKRAQERRTYLEANRALTDWMHDLDDAKNISILVSPLVSEKESMLNAIENEQSDGERSTGVLSASDESLSEVAEESDDGSKRVHIDASQGNDTARKENAQNAELEGIQMTFQRKQQFWSDDSLFLNQESFSTF